MAAPVKAPWAAPALRTDDAAYAGLLFTASYCPSCKDFLPRLEAAAPQLKDLDVVVVGNDRTKEAHDAYIKALPDAWAKLPFESAAAVRDGLRAQFGVRTIPYLVIVEKKSGQVVTTAGRDAVVADPTGQKFPWKDEHAVAMSLQGTLPAAVPTFKQRFFTTPLLAFGHTGVSTAHPGSAYMDENAVRARAGILNIFSCLVLITLTFFSRSVQERVFISLYPIIALDFLAGGTVGLTPLAPVGCVATAIAWLLHPRPVWTPARPKRFAWAIGFTLANTCFFGWLGGLDYIARASAGMCFAATWLESSLGFCVGCFIYNHAIVPTMGWEACAECV